MSGYRLFGSRRSGSAIAEAGLAIAGIDYRLIDAATWLPESALAELHRVNPLGQIPTLVLPGGEVLTESAAILIHLGLMHPACGLLPDSASGRAHVIRGLVYLAANCYSAISVIDYPERWCADADDDEPAKERIRRGTRQRLYHHWEIFADAFLLDRYLSGAAPGALDWMASVVSRWAGTRSHLREARPAFATLMDELDRHPAVTAVFSRHWEE
ncbi:MAG: Glutathione S-transferase-like protein [Hydrocarboniphaga sp.]|uniref:glutathione S-transferase family protein n=1 Tax=Hydrocarboniphaga sp. TaxID=2033016 RepID=UPI0026380DE4|nr:glutathione S-transferase [Hydrocarboniphaga sp.]MDB5968442.1 Glutathione S-transferase-like protein [Hydrocarboniphaga sp.]